MSATLKELEAEAKRTGKPQVRMTIVTVWPDGSRLTTESHPPVDIPNVLKTLRMIWNPLLRHHYKKRLVKERSV